MDFHTLINSILTVFVSRRQIITKQLKINGQTLREGGGVEVWGETA